MPGSSKKEADSRNVGFSKYNDLLALKDPITLLKRQSVQTG